MEKNKTFAIHRKKIFCPFCSSTLCEIFTNGQNRLFCPRCKSPIYENPIPATCVVLINNKNQTLLVKRNINPQKGKWCLPGGFIEIGETPEEAAKRELKEETGLKGKIEKLISISPSNKKTLHSIIVIGYLVKNFSGTLIPGDDASEAVFFYPWQLPQVAFVSHRNFISASYSKNLCNL